MFIKVTKSKNYHYLQIVESYREGGKTRHRVLFNLGRFEKLSGNQQLLSLGKRLLKLGGQPVEPLELEEETRLCYGHKVYQKLWDKFQLSKILTQVSRTNRIRFDLCAVIFYLVVERLLSPSSKYASWQNQAAYLDLPQDIPLQHIYRSLDVLAQRKELIEQELFKRHRTLFNMKVDVVFYDVTTFHFESNHADELRDFGFSKAGKFNEVQVVMGLLVDKEGRPIGYELFEGNVFDGKTLVKALKILKERFEIRKLILVADKGLNSGANLHLIKQAGYEYVVSCRLKNESKKIKETALNQQDFQVVRADKITGAVTFQYKIIAEHNIQYKDEQGIKHTLKDNIVVTWSAKRAKRDRLKRQRLIEKAQQMIEQGKIPNNKKGAKKYLLTQGKEKVQGMDEEKIKKDAAWDGFYAIQYSDPNLSYDKILEHYHLLWKIEESFRVLKSTLHTRPIFHWNPKRIKGYFVLCFIAFLLERNLELILKQKNIEGFSVEKIKAALNSLQVSKILLNGQSLYIKGKHLPLATKILQALNIKALKNLSFPKT
ncbi:MAG: IS1634 family transposase [Bacteroidetes bacterium]|nr:MAG: IS1634 family transposase [Bacteroidota bacterium]